MPVAKKKVTKKVAPKGKKRGRPVGSKNKGPAKERNPKSLKKRGRPPKVKEVKASTECDDYDDYVPPKSYKFLGYCPKKGCMTIVSEQDLASKQIFVCIKCGKRDKISKLIKERPVKTMSKKAFLQDSNMLT